MAELIQNGYFEADVLDPWTPCDSNELGEAWICLEDEEPDFDYVPTWDFGRGAEVTGENRVFLTDYNLKMSENDGVVQMLETNARATGNLSMWVHCSPIDLEAGTLYAFVCYRDKTFHFNKIGRDDLYNHCGPEQLVVQVEDKLVEKVVICVVGAVASWFISGITLEGIFAEDGGFPSYPRPAKFFENRIAVLEQRVDRLFRMLATRRPVREIKPRPGKGK